MRNLKSRYELVTITATVVGAVIGSGVFFKAESLARITCGNVAASIVAWMTGAAVMLLCLSAFMEITKAEGESDLCFISKNILGYGFSTLVGTFMSLVYYPSLVSVLSYLCARYTLLSVGLEGNFLLCGILALLLLATNLWQNAFAMNFSGKFQLVTTFLKLIPLFLMIVLGISGGFARGTLHKNFSAETIIPFHKAFFPAVTATLFAYEGWISAAGIGAKSENAGKKLPLALLAGGFIIASVYILYYLGITGAVETKILINYGSDGIRTAFYNIVGKWGNLLTLFVAVSCLGALNALAMGLVNANKSFHKNAPRSTFSLGVVTSSLWLLWVFCNRENHGGKLWFDSTELPVVTIYALYIPLFLNSFRRERRRIKKALYTGGIVSSVFVLVCGFIAHSGEVVSYLCILTSIMLAGSLLHKKTG